MPESTPEKSVQALQCSDVSTRYIIGLFPFQLFGYVSNSLMLGVTFLGISALDRSQLYRQYHSLLRLVFLVPPPQACPRSTAAGSSEAAASVAKAQAFDNFRAAPTSHFLLNRRPTARPLGPKTSRRRRRTCFSQRSRRSRISFTARRCSSIDVPKRVLPFPGRSCYRETQRSRAIRKARQGVTSGFRMTYLLGVKPVAVLKPRVEAAQAGFFILWHGLDELYPQGTNGV
ncbi:hypothetical protein GGR56DRAFT_506471 [Xylariaceae sp. FL0804]|nr:hypothetical protein GGR56DRAFT_506471 [Xylariaceae sp. FL0804]